MRVLKGSVEVIRHCNEKHDNKQINIAKPANLNSANDNETIDDLAKSFGTDLLQIQEQDVHLHGRPYWEEIINLGRLQLNLQTGSS